MSNKLVTLAIHSHEKAIVLKKVLEGNNISVLLENIDDLDSEINNLNNFYVKINGSDLSRALSIIEENKLFSYQNKSTLSIDDGRRRILVAIDFSDYSTKACQVAFNMAKETNAKVKIIHIYQNIYYPSHIPFSDQLKDKTDVGLLDKVRSQMLKFCTEIEQKITDGLWPSVNYSYSIREGLVDEEIENFVSEYNPNLLVLGTKGMDNNDSSVFGNVAADIIEIVNVPVLAISVDSPINRLSDIKHIVFLTNFRERDLTSFDYLVEITKPYDNVRITLLHVNRINSKGDKWANTELVEMKKYFKIQYPQLNIEYELIDSPDISQAISSFLAKRKVDLLSLNTRRRSLFGRVFSPSMSRKMLDESNKAILVLRS